MIQVKKFNEFLNENLDNVQDAKGLIQNIIVWSKSIDYVYSETPTKEANHFYIKDDGYTTSISKSVKR